MNIEVIRGADADLLLSDESFPAHWDALWRQCPWATAFQSPGFVGTWYSIYRHRFEPLLILSRAADGSLQGLLTLARSSANQQVILATRRQAWCHTWICAPDVADEFAWQAIAAALKEMACGSLRFHYLAANAPLGWLNEPQARRLCFLADHRRPIFRLGDGREIKASLNKSSNKSKLRRLEKMGALTFTRITDPAEFEAMFDDIVRLYDFRRGAVFGDEGFNTTELQKPFHLALLQAKALHVTAMRVGGRLVSAHIGIRGNKVLPLGILVHEPALARHSPGKIHMLLLCQMLLQDGYEVFDLGPGGDYKERFANDADVAHTLVVDPTRLKRTRTVVRERIAETFKTALQSTLTRFNITPAQAREYAKSVRQPARLRSIVLGRLRMGLGPNRPMLVYARAADLPPDNGFTEAIRRDSLEDLLAYHPGANGPSRQAFLADAQDRLERGQHVYTYAENSRLIHAVWTVESADLNGQSWPGFTAPPNCLVVSDLNASSENASAEYIARCLAAIMRDVDGNRRVEKIIVLVPGNRITDRQALEGLGFSLVK